MLQSKQRLLELNAKLAETLTDKGVSATADETTTALIDKVKNISGADKLVEFSQVRPEVQSYLDNVTYDPDDYTTSQIVDYVTSTSNNQPVGCKINLKSAGTLIIYDSANGGSTITNSVAGDNYIYNFTPNAICHYVNIVDGDIEQSGTVKATGACRMIKSASAYNIRDLGGWTCDGGTVKYGKLFRGGVLSDSDKDVMVNQLRIRHDLDLRGISESEGITSSPLGNAVNYTCTNKFVWYALDNTDDWTLILSTIFNAVSKNEPLYFHCSAGADRTGTVACIIEAILGVSQSDIDKEYELTCFYTGVDTNNKARRRNESDWTGLINEINNYSGDSFRDKVANYLVSAGVSINDINAFRHSMIDGTPDDLTVVEYATITNNLTNATSSNTDVSIKKSNSYTATITAADGYTLTGATVTVTIGGTDITSSAYVDGVINIDNVTDDIVITVTAKRIIVNLYNKDEVTLNKRHSGSGIVAANGRFITNYIAVVTGDILNIYHATKINYDYQADCPCSYKIAYYDTDKNLLGTKFLYPNGSDTAAVTTVVDDNNATVKIGYYGSGNLEDFAENIAYVMIEIVINNTATAITTDDVLDLVIYKI